MRLLRRLLKNRSGATSLEYGLIISLMFLVILTALVAFGDTSTGIFNGAMNAIRSAMGG
ncbi:MAG TPA: Flp family type IVb pilin [Brevundimonas sp.]|jgi:pilus assembly protein Flp/PilA|uniref:Flp family type IVb pilin n=1 Tax=Brevundimonas sp. TaxID=1871086 RepID=UPI002DF0C23B|nr:Flp family type IVb pilin [Brevundimonas sp.]